jgi:hypothetical protein
MEILSYMWKAYILERFQPTQSIIRATTLGEKKTNTNIKKCKQFFSKYSSLAMKCLDFMPFNMATTHILVVVTTLKFLHLFLPLHHM